MIVCITAIFISVESCYKHMKLMVLVRLDLNRKKLGMAPGVANKFFRRLYVYYSCSHAERIIIRLMAC